MEFGKVIIVNRMVMALISSKYPGRGPGGFTEADGRYYEKLDRENELAIRVLGREAPTLQKIDSYTKLVRAIVADLEKDGSHKFKGSASKVP